MSQPMHWVAPCLLVTFVVSGCSGYQITEEDRALFDLAVEAEGTVYGRLDARNRSTDVAVEEVKENADFSRRGLDVLIVVKKEFDVDDAANLRNRLYQYDEGVAEVVTAAFKSDHYEIDGETLSGVEKFRQSHVSGNIEELDKRLEEFIKRTIEGIVATVETGVTALGIALEAQLAMYESEPAKAAAFRDAAFKWLDLVYTAAQRAKADGAVSVALIDVDKLLEAIESTVGDIERVARIGITAAVRLITGYLPGEGELNQVGKAVVEAIIRSVGPLRDRFAAPEA